MLVRDTGIEVGSADALTCVDAGQLAWLGELRGTERNGE